MSRGRTAARIRRALGALAVVSAFSLAPAAHAARGIWLAGDLHVHTTYSHDSYGGPTDDNTGPQDFYTLGYTVTEDFLLAATRGLDYLAITDHNDIRSQSDPGFGAFGVLPVPAEEASLKGHAQMLGARRLYPRGDKSVAAVRAMAALLHRDGGVFQANHPNDPRWEYGYDVPLDSVEVWNLPWYYEPPFPAASDNDKALRYWEGWLDRGERVGATGGSDSHWRSTSAAQGPGQPTTWVFAADRSLKGILAGLRAGHTFVSHQPPVYGGPKLFLEADGDRDGSYESMAGDSVAPGSRLRARVRGAAGAELRIVTDGGREAFAPVSVTSGDFEHRFTVPRRSTWVRAEVFGRDEREQRQSTCSALFGADVTNETPYCTNRVLMLALTSAIYLRVAGTAPGPQGERSAGARLHGPRGCVRRTFVARVTGAGVTRVVYFVDGRRAGAAGRRRRYARRIGVRRLGSGRHALSARVSFADAPRATLRRAFRVCRRSRSADPHLTG
jgi:uncharacterized protein DUF3604